jgi:hypothetical protein
MSRYPPGHIPSTCLVMTSRLWKATLGQLMQDLLMEHPFRAHLLSTHPGLMNIQVLQICQPAPPHMTLHALPLLSFTSLPSIPLLYETTKVCPTESETMKSVFSGDFITAKATSKAKSMSDYITALVCKSKLTSPFITAKICSIEVSTKYDNAKCRCKLERVVVSEGIQVAVPELVEQVITQPVEGVVPPPGGEIITPPPPVEDIWIPVPEPL